MTNSEPTLFTMDSFSTVSAPALGAAAAPVSLADLYSAAEGYAVSFRPSGNEYARMEKDEFKSWDAVVDAGRRYLVGETMPMEAFLKSYTSPLTAWQKLAYRWALENPADVLCIDNARFEWRVKVRGEYVEFGLPHQDFGGERHYVSLDGKKKVLINID